MSDVSIDSTVLEDFHPSESFSEVQIRVFVSEPFIPAGETEVIQSGPPLWYKEFDCSVSGDTLTIPAITLPATTDGTPSSARYKVAFYKNGSRIGSYQGFERFALPPSPASTTWQEIFQLTNDSIPVSSVITLGDAQVSGGTFSGAVIKGYPRTIEVNTEDAGNVGTGEDELHSFSLPAGSLANDGDFLRVRYSGTFAANGNNKRIQLSFAGQVAHNSGARALNGGGFDYDLLFVRLSATSVRVVGQIIWNFSASATFTNSLFAQVSSDLTVANLDSNATEMLVEAEATDTDDVVQNLSVIELVQR